jgi:hypothetical protein
MSRLAIPIMLAVATGGCGAASAKSYDSSDPVHCMTIYGATSGTVRTGPLADELNARILHIARTNGGTEWIRRITPVSAQLGAQWEAAADKAEIIKLFEECRKRQDADPSFTAALPQLMRQGKSISSGAR